MTQNENRILDIGKEIETLKGQHNIKLERLRNERDHLKRIVYEWQTGKQ